MTVVIKCDPPAVSGDGIATFDERIRYGAQPQRGDTAYVWEAETAGGSGLAMSGTIEDVHVERGRAELRVRIDRRNTNRPLTVEMLRSHRDAGDFGALTSLARKLYRHAHNKITPLDADEANFLEAFF